MSGKFTDTEMLDWLEGQDGSALVSDDAGRWAVSGDGIQNCPSYGRPTDIWTAVMVEAAQWRGSIRDAIEAAMMEENVA